MTTQDDDGEEVDGEDSHLVKKHEEVKAETKSETKKDKKKKKKNKKGLADFMDDFKETERF